MNSCEGILDLQSRHRSIQWVWLLFHLLVIFESPCDWSGTAIRLQLPEGLYLLK